MGQGQDETMSNATDFRVVCISRTLAAGGESIGRAVAQRLGFRYVDEQIITTAARQAQVDPKLVAAAEHRQPLLQRLLAKIPAARDLAGPVSLAVGLPLDGFAGEPAGYRVTEDDLRLLIRAAVEEVGRAGQAVIVAHAASMALAGVAGVLRVLITASPETRARRLAKERDINEEEAAAAVAASDRERRSYFQHFYGITEELPTHYDLVINTDVLAPDLTADLVVAAVRTGA
jgi:Cytidylate kinase-like family